MTDSIGNAKVICKVAKQFPRKPVMTVFLGGKVTQRGIDYVEKYGLKNFDDVSKAALALARLRNRR